MNQNQNQPGSGSSSSSSETRRINLSTVPATPPRTSKSKQRQSDNKLPAYQDHLGLQGASQRAAQPQHTAHHEVEDHHAPLLGRSRSQDGRNGRYEPEMMGQPGFGRWSGDYRRTSDFALEGGGEDISLEQRKALWWRSSLITGMFILAWYGFATLLSLYNKWMFSPQYKNFGYPLFVTFCHMIVQFCLAWLVRTVFPQFKPVERPTRQDYVSKVIPAAMSTGGDIGLSNLSLKTITLTLYTMCKSSALIFVLGFAFLFKLEQFSLRLIGVILFITFGVFLMVFDTTAVSIPGIIMVFSASALSGLRWALTETIMHKGSMGLSNPFATIFWLAPLMAITLAIVSLFAEDWSGVFGQGHFDGAWNAFLTTCIIVFPGGLAFSMVASEYFIIQRAGIVPLSVAGIFKEISTLSFSAWLFGDTLTEPNVIGVIIAMTGIALFSYHKYQKSITSPTPLHDSEGRKLQISDTSPLIGNNRVLYAPPPGEDLTPPTSPGPPTDGMPLSPIRSNGNGNDTKNKMKESPEERRDRLRDEFEGWNDTDWDRDDVSNEDEEEEEGHEADHDTVQRLRDQRVNGGGHLGSLGEEEGRSKHWYLRSWGSWWDQKM